jgi:hypothetical protein
MNLEQYLQAGVHWADLKAVDSHFTSLGITEVGGMVNLKAALIALANVTDFELTIRATYQAQSEPSVMVKPFRANLEFAKYLRNKVIGHIHPSLISKAIEWQPMLRHAPRHFNDEKFQLLVSVWLLETAINTYVHPNGLHKFFDSETDLFYTPDWKRFLDYLEATIRGSISFLSRLQEIWAPTLPSPVEGDLSLYKLAGKTEFIFLKQ